MSAELVGTAGPLKGALVPLAADEISIGRDDSNRICIDDEAASRRHCLIRPEGDGFRLIDLNSRNGTLVNGQPVTERLLQPGDEIRIGDSAFLLVVRQEEIPAAQSFTIEERMLDTQSTVHLRREDARYLQPDRLQQDRPDPARLARDLSVLLRINTTVHSAGGTQALAEQLLDAILEVSPGEHASVCLADSPAGDFVPIATRSRAGAVERPMLVNRPILQQVLRDGIAISGVTEGDKRAVLAVPIASFGRTTGVLYVDSSDPGDRFDEDLLQLMTGIGAIAGLAFEEVRNLERLQAENQRLQAAAGAGHDMLGQSPGMREVYRLVARVAPSDATVLILGESGVGKELVARAIHRNSRRASKPFVAVNCAAVVETLAESELFGHEKGAFTEARALKKGRFELAHQGTLFLDEIGDLAPATQAKLLRALQERKVQRVGGERDIPVDFRLIAATNRNLEEDSRSGKFRQDLYFRLNVISLKIPPLRERPQDIPELAEYFRARYSHRFERRVTGIARDAMECLRQYDWKGNVRELENAIERAVLLCSADVIQREDLPEKLWARVGEVSPPADYYELMRAAQRDIIRQALARSGGNQAEAARLLGVHSNWLHRLVKKLDLKGDTRPPRTNSVGGAG